MKRILLSIVFALTASSIVPMATAADPITTPVVNARDVSSELDDARNFAYERLELARNAIREIDHELGMCFKVSNEFTFAVKQLFDSTNLSYYCDVLVVKPRVITLLNKLSTLNPSQAKTVDAANFISDRADSIADEAHELLAQIANNRDELFGIQEQLSPIVANLKIFNEAESYVVDAWKTLNERIAFLPKTLQSTIQKSQNYKSSSSFVTQLKKLMTSRDSLLERLSSLEDPRKLTPVASQLSALKINPTEAASFDKSLDIIKKSIPAMVCSKSSLTVLPSKSGTCPKGYKKISTL
jgi:uncharacterized phage infection (PIP) family protein YhgE